MNAVEIYEKAQRSLNRNEITVGEFEEQIAVLKDVEPVVHGRWITHNKGQNNWCECSECNTVGSPFWKRCPVCEAKMDGERREGE